MRLALVARLHYIAADPHALAHRLGRSAHEPLAPDDLLLGARELGLRARRIRAKAESLAATPMPVLALMRDGSVAVLARCEADRVLLQRFAAGSGPRPLIEPVAEWMACRM